MGDETVRRKILEIGLKGVKNLDFTENSAKFEQLVEISQGFSGSEIIGLCNEGKIRCVSKMIEAMENANDIKNEEKNVDFEEFLEVGRSIKPIANEEMMARYR